MKTNSLQAVICSYKGPFVTEKTTNKQTKKKQNFSQSAIDHKIECISNNLNSDFVH